MNREVRSYRVARAIVLFIYLFILWTIIHCWVQTAGQQENRFSSARKSCFFRETSAALTKGEGCFENRKNSTQKKIVELDMRGCAAH